MWHAACLDRVRSCAFESRFEAAAGTSNKLFGTAAVPSDVYVAFDHSRIESATPPRRAHTISPPGRPVSVSHAGIDTAVDPLVDDGAMNSEIDE
jgi:hypothetical protein